MTILTFLKYLRGIFNTTLKSGTVHHAIIQSIYDSFIMVDNDIDYMRLEMCLSTASGSWLDYWGDFFTVQRKNNETDSNYSRRIIEHIIRPKTTIPALKSYIVEYLNDEYQTTYVDDDVQIKEPWKEIGKLSHKGLLSKDALFYSSGYYRHSVIDISIPERLTQGLLDLVHSVKAAGVKVIWSFLNSYGIATGFNEVNWAQADYHRHILTQTQRNTYGGLILSNSSPNPCLSGRREIWFELINQYYWYAKMLDKDTDKSIIITKLDLVKMLDHYKVIETLVNVADTGSRLDVNATLSNANPLSGALSETQQIERLVAITETLLDKIKFVDEWLTLSQEGELSQSSGVMFEFQTAHEVFCDLYERFEAFKSANIDYYNNLQPPIITFEGIAQWYVKPHANWLFDTPTMTQADFYELWELDRDTDTLEDIYAYEQVNGKPYLTFGDVYQPPIVIAGSPWDWTPVMDNPWLWNSETLTNAELEEIYLTKFSGFPDLVEIVTELTYHPENSLILSQNGRISDSEYNIKTVYEHNSTSNLRLSDDGELNTKVLSGAKVNVSKILTVNESFTGFTYLSGMETTVTKRKVVTENTPTLGALIDFENNQDVGIVNEPITYSTRDWFQAPIQIGEFAQWLVSPHIRQLWNTKALTNDEIRSFWDSPDGMGTAPDDFKEQILSSENIYQPPIVRTDTPFYWLTDHTEFDNGWLYDSQTLTNEDWEQAYWNRFKDYPNIFPDMTITTTVTPTYPDKQFRLSDNAYFPYRQLEITVEQLSPNTQSFTLSHNAIISNRKTEYRYDIQTIYHPEQSFTLSQSILSQPQYFMNTYMEYHPEDNFYLSNSPLDSKSLSGGAIVPIMNWVENIVYDGPRKLSGTSPDIIKTQQAITYDILPLAYLSGNPIETQTTYKLLPDENGRHYLSGYIVQPYEEISVIERPVTLGSLIELEENQDLFKYSVRYLSQAPIQLGEQVLWLITVNNDQLWDTPTITKQDLMKLWIGEKPKSIRALGKRLKADTIRYQPPIELSSQDTYWSVIKALPAYLFWDTPTIANDKIVKRWIGNPVSADYVKLYIQTSSVAYQPPIEMSYTIELGMPEKLMNRQLWNSPSIANEEILSFWEGANKPSIEEFESIHLTNTTIYQPPIVITFRSDTGSWIPELDTPWLWDSQSIHLEDLESLYQNQFPEETKNQIITLGLLIDLEKDYEYSKRSICQAPITTDNNVLWKTDVPADKLWDTDAISNKEILSFWEGKPKPTVKKYRTTYLADEPFYTLPIITT